MLFQLSTLTILVAEAILATYVAARAWDYRPARFFVLVVASLMLSTTGTFISEQTSEDWRFARIDQMGFESLRPTTLAAATKPRSPSVRTLIE